MDGKKRRARVVNWENDDKYISVWYTDNNGERVCADFKRIGWSRAPSDVVARVMEALNSGPLYVVGSRGHPPPSSLEEPGMPPQQQDL
jgi:hypothetical protein